MNKKMTAIIFTCCTVFLSACASIDPPTTLHTQAKSNVEQAQSIGADKEAPLALREANQYLAKAEVAISEKEYEEAQYLLEKSVINSELAIATTNAKQSQAAAAQINENLDALRKETRDDM